MHWAESFYNNQSKTFDSTGNTGLGTMVNSGLVVESHLGTQAGLGKSVVNVGQLTNISNISGMPPKEIANIEDAGQNPASQMALRRDMETLTPTTSLSGLHERTTKYHEYNLEFINERPVTSLAQIHLTPKPTHPKEVL